MEKFEFYDWQRNAYSHIAGQSAVLSAPTGSGKTLCAYLWAGLLDEEGNVRRPDSGRIIFTAPIKALSNERYMDLRRMGLDVGIETGDFKRNEGAQVICCTQEIYTMKYAPLPASASSSTSSTTSSATRTAPGRTSTASGPRTPTHPFW